MTKKKNITVVGSDYVGMSLAALLSKSHKVLVMDIDHRRVDLINQGKSTITDPDMDDFLTSNQLNLSATMNKQKAYADADFIIVATPTDYDVESNRFDTSSVDSVVDDAIKYNNKALIVLKSTIPVGHTNFLSDKHSTDRIIFSPEFLREGHALKDNQSPSRIIIGCNQNKGAEFAEILDQISLKKGTQILYVGAKEAEAIKLFANTYLAMRVSFFNELDSYAIANNLTTQEIIDGVCLDRRIGEGYNNPSFGYGGYCLPKDTKQLLANYDFIPQNLIQAIVQSNRTRKDFIASEIIKKNPKTVGFFRLIMKSGSDNFRSSAILGVIKRVKALGIDVVIFEKSLNEESFYGSPVIKDIDEFKKISDVIVVNRVSEELSDVEQKVFSRDIYNRDS